MRKMLIIILSLCVFYGLFAQFPPPPGESPYWDMAIPDDYDIPEDQQKMIMDQYRMVYDMWSQSPTPGYYSKGQTGHLILDLFATGDTLSSAASTQFYYTRETINALAQSVNQIVGSIYFITDSVYSQYDLIDNLHEYLKNGYDDSVMQSLIHTEMTFYNSLYESQMLWEKTFHDVDSLLDSCGTRFDDVLAADEDFVFRIGTVEMTPSQGVGLDIYDTTEVAVIYDETYKSINGALINMENGIHQISAGLRCIFEDSLSFEGIDTLRMAMASFTQVLDTLNNPYMLDLIDTTILYYWNKHEDQNDSVTFRDVKDVLASIDSLLDGKIYMLGENPEIPFRPVGILENIPYGLYQTYIDLYSQQNPFVYNFRNIFPAGLPMEVIIELLPDLVIDPRDDKASLMAYLATKRGEFDMFLQSMPEDINAHVGRAYIDLIFMLDDLGMQIDQILALVEGGRIDSLFQNYNWMNLDYSLELASIQMDLDYHMSCMYNDTNLVLFTVIVKDPGQSSPGELIAPGDMIYPLYIAPPISGIIVNTSYAVQYGLERLGNGLQVAYEFVDSLVDITLDPNYLNLADVEGPLDLIYRFQAANPDFGEFTPAGKVVFSELGGRMKNGMHLLSDFSDTLIATMAYADSLMYELGMSEYDYNAMMNDLFSVSQGVKMLSMDMDYPSIYSYFGNDTINASAWFDSIPDNLVKVFQGYLEGTDPTMAGFFPMANIVVPDTGETAIEIIPEEFALKANYPNPFNPFTTISFDIPDEGDVTMSIFNIAGQKVIDLISNRKMNAGSYELTWNASNYSSGVYLVRIQYETQIAYRKMTLLK